MPSPVVRSAACALLLYGTAGVAPCHAEPARHPAVPSLPLVFEPVTTPDTAPVYVARSGEYGVTISTRGAEIHTSDGAGRPALVSIGFDRGHARKVGADDSPAAVANYLVGAADAWRTGVRLDSRVRLEQVWDGIDVVFYGSGRLLEYDFILAPGTTPQRIGLKFSGTAPARIEEDGTLLLATAAGALRQHAPFAYQRDASGHRQRVDCAYVLRVDGTVGLQVGGYDHSAPLIIDPVLAYATYLGGSGGEFWFDSVVAGISADAQGNVIVAGDTSAVWTVQGQSDLRTAPAGRDVFVAKLNASGSALQWITYLGGNGNDDRAGLAVGSDGTLFVSGRTNSNNLPVTPGAAKRTLTGTQDAFVAHLSADGRTLLYLTYVGGSGIDFANAIAVDPAGQAVVVGATDSSDLQMAGTPAQTTLHGSSDAFVTMLNATGTGYVFETYMGGSNIEVATGVGVGTGGQIFVTGQTQSSDFPKLNAVQGALSGTVDPVAFGLSTSGSLLFSTYLGGSAATTLESATRLATGPGNSFVIVGVTDSTDFPTNSAVQPTPGGALDGFAAKFVWNGTTLTRSYSTYLGGSQSEAAFGLAVDSTGRAAVVGASQSTNFPPLVGAFDTTLAGGQDAFIVILSADGTTIQQGSYFGGSGIDTGLAAAFDAQGDVYVIGQTTSVDMPTTSFGGGSAYDDSFNGAEDAFVIRLSGDRDGDGLPDVWEISYGLNPDDATGDNGANGDHDRDFLTNLDEYRGGTNPLESERYFAEGATGTGVDFDTRFAVLNPQTDVPVDVHFEFFTGTQQLYTYTLANLRPGQRATVDAKHIPGLPELADAQFSTVIRSTYGVIADRTMTWNASGYGSHAETSVLRPATTWYLAEGATHSHFDLFYLLQNAQTTDAVVQVTYLLPAPQAPLTKTYTVPARSRFNIWVNQERFPDQNGQLLLSDAEVSARLNVLNGVPIIVERAMYQTPPGQPTFSAGHESAAVNETATRWFLAEGATNANFFDLFVLLANPSNEAANVKVTYLLPDGSTIVRLYGGPGANYPAVAAASRQTIWVNFEDPRLANTAVSTIVESTNGVGIIVERAMWWPGPSSGNWTEASNSFGTTTTGTTWGLAEGELGGPNAAETYILIANTSPYAGRASVTLHYEDGTTDSTTVPLNATSRYTVGVATLGFAKAANAKFGAIVQALPAAGGTDVPQIVVERAMYSADVGRAFVGNFPPGTPYWPAGTNAVATKMR